MDINMKDPFQRELMAFADKIDETKEFTQAIKTITAKGRKYATYKAIQDTMGCDDEEFDEALRTAMKANKHSNKFIFTHDGEEPSVGITAAKRKNNTPSANPGYGIAHTKGSGVNQGVDARDRIIEHRENELYTILRRDGWRGLDKLDILPEGWQKMTEKAIVDEIIMNEITDQKV